MTTSWFIWMPGNSLMVRSTICCSVALGPSSCEAFLATSLRPTSRASRALVTWQCFKGSSRKVLQGKLKESTYHVKWQPGIRGLWNTMGCLHFPGKLCTTPWLTYDLLVELEWSFYNGNLLRPLHLLITKSDTSPQTWGQREGNKSYQFESGKGKPTKLLNGAAERTQFLPAKKVRLVNEDIPGASVILEDVRYQIGCFEGVLQK